MARKTTPKKVIDYDPLAWLDEADGSRAEQTQVAAKKSPAPDQQPPTEESSAYGFFDEEPETGSAQAAAQPASASDEQEQTTAYGFFDDDWSDNAADPAVAGATEGVIDLGAELTIRSIAESKTMIDRALASGQDLRIDISQLQKIDSAGVQMIYSLIQTLPQTTQTVSWIGTNPMINDAASLLGLVPMLDDQPAAFGFFTDENDPAADTDGAFGFF